MSQFLVEVESFGIDFQWNLSIRYLSSWSTQIKKRKLRKTNFAWGTTLMGSIRAGFVGFAVWVRGFAAWVRGFWVLLLRFATWKFMGSPLECWFGVLISCFQCFTNYGCRGFFFSNVVHFFSNGEEEELTEVFRRLWLSLIFFFSNVMDVFFRGRRGRRRLRYLRSLLWKSSV